MRAGSLAAAARRLRVTPMVATRSLAALEGELGVRLLHRTTRSLALTDEGQTFLVHAQALLEEHDAALASVQSADAEATGRLRLTASSAFGRKVVAPALVGFMRRNPRIEVDLLLTDTIVDPVGAGLDLAIRIAPLADTSLIARRLADNPRGLFASPTYLAERGSPRSMSDLRGHECLTISGTNHWAFDRQGRAASATIGGRFSANTIEGIHQACLGGLGLALLSYWEVADELRTGDLVEVTLSDARPDTIAIWAVYPTRRLVPGKVRLFIDYLTGHLAAK